MSQANLEMRTMFSMIRFLNSARSRNFLSLDEKIFSLFSISASLGSDLKCTFHKFFPNIFSE